MKQFIASYFPSLSAKACFSCTCTCNCW